MNIYQSSDLLNTLLFSIMSLWLLKRWIKKKNESVLWFFLTVFFLGALLYGFDFVFSITSDFVFIRIELISAVLGMIFFTRFVNGLYHIKNKSMTLVMVWAIIATIAIILAPVNLEKTNLSIIAYVILFSYAATFPIYALYLWNKDKNLVSKKARTKLEILTLGIFVWWLGSTVIILPQLLGYGETYLIMSNTITLLGLILMIPAFL